MPKFDMVVASYLNGQHKQFYQQVLEYGLRDFLDTAEESLELYLTSGIFKRLLIQADIEK